MFTGKCWYSNELKTVVLTTRKDPRSGESNCKLTNLRRGEPSGQSFEVPFDYKIITGDNVGPEVIRMKMKKNQEYFPAKLEGWRTCRIC